MKLKTIIVEDSREITQTILHFLVHSPVEIDIVGTAETLQEAHILILENEIHLALLDIQLKGDNIFKLLKELKNQGKISFDIIFITAHSSFENAVKAIQYACMDFISKPISQELLFVSLQQVLDRRKLKQAANRRVDLLLELLQSNLTKPQSLSISRPKGIIEVLELQNVCYLEADANTCLFHLENKGHIHSTQSFGHFAKLLDTHPDYFQVSRDLIVNILQIKRYNHRDKAITLKNGTSLIVSHRYSKYLKQRLLKLNSSPKSGLMGFLK